MRQATAAGKDLLFFAEGTFAREAGLLPFRPGALVTAAEAAMPVVPIALRGTRTVLRGDEWFPRRGGIVVRFGAAIHPEDDAWQRALRLSRSARAFILAHCGEPDTGGAPPDAAA